MGKLGQVLTVAAAMAFTASPVFAGGVLEWDWSWTDACGGSNFETCMSGSIDAYWVEVGGTGIATILVDVKNVTPYEGDVFTAVGLFNMPSGYSPSITANDLSGWSVQPNYNGINGDLTSETYAINGDNGSNNGFGEDDLFHSFTFTFTGVSQTALRDWEDMIGVGIHAQRGPTGCSTKMGVMLDVASGAGEAVENATDDEDCSVSVPEPGSMALLASGAVGMAFLARRRRNGVELVDEDGNEI